MDMQLYKLVLVMIATLAGSYVQSVTGFGFGIIAMMFLPGLMAFTEANVLSSILGAFTSVMVILSVYRRVNWKNIVFPLISSTVTNYLAISFMSVAATDTLTLLLGIALFALSIYFFFFSSRIRIRATWYAGLIAGSVSGLMSGLFSIGGPAVVVYFLQSEKDTDSYVATISAYFLFSGIVSITLKALSGFVTGNVLAGTAIGVIGMVLGSLLGKRTRAAINPTLLKKAVYGFMAVSGLINVITSLVG